MHKVIQWGTGTVGRHAIRSMIDKPELQLVGTFVYNPDKVGKDAGGICGIDPIGVTATGNRDEILGLPADCVLYMALGEEDSASAVADICALLASGKNVVSTAVTALLHPLSLGQPVMDSLEDACRRGNSSFLATGIQPGWGSLLPVIMSSIFRRVDSVVVQEVLNYATYNSAATLFDSMGFGKQPQPVARMSIDPHASGSFGGPLLLIAKGFGVSIDEMIYECELAVADESFDIAAGRIEAGTVSGKRFSLAGLVKGREMFKIEHVTRLSEDTAPHWPQGRGWNVFMKGDPGMDMMTVIAPEGGDENDAGCLGTAMAALHAIAPLCAAKTGVQTLVDIPMMLGRDVF